MREDLNPLLEDKGKFYILESVMVDALLYLNPMLKKMRTRLGLLNIETLTWKVL